MVSSKKTKKAIAILGSTGSIGLNTLDVIKRHADEYKVVALTANTQVDRLFEQCQLFGPEKVVLVDEQASELLRQKIQEHKLDIEVLHGKEALCQVARESNSEIVMAAIVGAAGLLPTLEAVKSGKRVLLANKEPLVMCGDLFLEAAEESGALMLPIDSEHNAIFQCMPADFRIGQAPEGLKRILLTGSGGPFLGKNKKEMENVTPEQACAHPNWNMGKKISVDSATLMNKGLEVIEACCLFGITAKEIEVLVHPQSVIHSMVEYDDGSVLAQLGMPDMRTPIANALAWPRRIDSGVARLDFLKVGNLSFEKPDTDSFPCLHLAYEAAYVGGTAPTILNASNEVAVFAFLDGKLNFTGIPAVIESTLNKMPTKKEVSLETVLEADRQARDVAKDFISGTGSEMGVAGQ